MEPTVSREQWDKTARKEDEARLEMSAHRVPPETPVNLAAMAKPANQEKTELMDHLEQRVQREGLVTPDHRASLGHGATKAPKAPKADQDLLERSVLMVARDQMDPRDRKELRGWKVKKAHKDEAATPGPMGDLGEWAHKEVEEPKETRV